MSAGSSAFDSARVRLHFASARHTRSTNTRALRPTRLRPLFGMQTRKRSRVFCRRRRCGRSPFHRAPVVAAATTVTAAVVAFAIVARAAAARRRATQKMAAGGAQTLRVQLIGARRRAAANVSAGGRLEVPHVL